MHSILSIQNQRLNSRFQLSMRAFKRGMDLVRRRLQTKCAPLFKVYAAGIRGQNPHLHGLVQLAREDFVLVLQGSMNRLEGVLPL